MSGVICFSRLEKISTGLVRIKALSWMFHRGQRIPWERLLEISTRVLVKRFDITKCVVACDDTFRERSRNTKNIHGVQKLKNKSTGGFFKGQNVIFLALVTPSITFICGFKFFLPDPEFKAWKANDNKLKKAGVPAKDRPKKPAKNKKYPTRLEIFHQLLSEFKSGFPEIKVELICADAAYFSKKSAKEVASIYPGVQFISRLKSSQVVILGNSQMTLKEYFSYLKAFRTRVRIRGHKDQIMYFAHEMLFLKAHGKKLKVVAVKYSEEEDFRFLVATDNSWIPRSIIEGMSRRWLIETSIQDWKGFDGWGTKASQQKEKGSSRGLVLSLLVDHCFLFHPIQFNRFQAGQSLVTTGSLRDHIRFESLKQTFQSIIYSDNPKEKLSKLMEEMDQVIQLRDSLKHLNGTEEFIPYLRPT